MDAFSPETAMIGGTAALTVHLTIMAQVRRFVPGRMSGLYDLLNYPLGFLLMVMVNPPWPLASYHEWRDYVGASIAMGALASVSAKKVLSGKDNASE